MGACAAGLGAALPADDASAHRLRPSADRTHELSAIGAALRHCAGGEQVCITCHAELLIKGWPNGDPARRVVLIATTRPWDDKMRERIARHRRGRAARVSGLHTVEEPLRLVGAIAAHATSAAFP